MGTKGKKLSRRTALKGLGGGGILLFTGGCTRIQHKIQDFLDYNTERRLAMEVILREQEGDVPWTNREEKWFTTTCLLCPARCGVSARVVDKNLVYVKGNPIHPFSKGGLCPVGIAGLQYMYSPDRLLSPQVREGVRGSGQWKQTGMGKVASTIERMLSSNPEKVVFITSEEKSLRGLLIKKFLSSVKNGYLLTFYPWSNLNRAVQIITGSDFTPVFDIANADLIVSFGFDFLGFSPNFMHFNKSYSAFRSSESTKVRHIQVESRLSLTGYKSHKWLPVKPGAHHLIAQIIAYILIKEDLVNRKFTEEFVEDYSRLKKEVVTGVNPSDLARQAGVNLLDVVKVAREVASSSKPLFIPGPEVLFSENGDLKASTILALNFLMGNIQEKGGLLAEENTLETILEEEIMGRRGHTYNVVHPSDIKSEFFRDAVVIITENHPLKLISPEGEFKKMLQKARFICYWGSYANDELAQVADALVPDATFMEREDLSLGISSYHLPVVSNVSKVVSSPYEVTDLNEFLLKKIKQTDVSFVKFKSVKDLKKQLLSKLASLKRGLISRGKEESEIVEFLEGYGFWVSLVPSLSEFVEQFEENGVWWDLYYNYGAVSRLISRRSRKVNLKSIVEANAHVQNKKPEQGKLYGIPIITHTAGLFSEHISLPWMVELFGWERHEKWQVWVEVNPETARKLALEDGDEVIVRSSAGKFKARVKLFPGVRPGAVNFPLVKADETSGRWAKELRQNTFAIFREDNIYTRSSPALFDITVEVEKA